MKPISNITQIMMLCTLSVTAFTFSMPAQADGAGAFLGGIAVAHIGRNVRERNEAEQDQAYYAEQQYRESQKQADSQNLTAEEKIAQLDKLAAGGYITPEEYNSRKKAILDSM